MQLIDASVLAELELELAEIKSDEKETAARYSSVRDRIFKIMDNLDGENIPVRWQGDATGNLMIIARELSPKEPTPMIDAEALERNLGSEMWERVSTPIRVLNEDLLADLVESGAIPVSAVELVTSYKQPVAKLSYKEPTAQERAIWEQNKLLKQQTA